MTYQLRLTEMRPVNLSLFLQVRTKSRDSQSSDSAPTPIPPAVLRGVGSRMPRGPGPGPAQPVAGFRGQRPQPYQQHQQVIEHDENLSDKEIFPSSNRPHDPQTTQVKIYLFYSCMYIYKNVISYSINLEICKFK